MSDSSTTIRLHARHAQRALEQTSEASKTDNVELKAQLYLNHTSGCISQRWFQMARSFLTKGCSAINVANLQFIPIFGLPSELAEEVQESLAVLSQLVYLENFLLLAIDRMKSKMMTRLETEFQRELQVRITITGLTCDRPNREAFHRKPWPKPIPCCSRPVRRPRRHREPCRSRMSCFSLPSIQLTVGNFAPTSISADPCCLN